MSSFFDMRVFIVVHEERLEKDIMEWQGLVRDCYTAKETKNYLYINILQNHE